MYYKSIKRYFKEKMFIIKCKKNLIFLNSVPIWQIVLKWFVSILWLMESFLCTFSYPGFPIELSTNLAKDLIFYTLLLKWFVWNFPCSFSRDNKEIFHQFNNFNFCVLRFQLLWNFFIYFFFFSQYLLFKGIVFWSGKTVHKLYSYTTYFNVWKIFHDPSNV